MISTSGGLGMSPDALLFGPHCSRRRRSVLLGLLMAYFGRFLKWAGHTSARAMKVARRRQKSRFSRQNIGHKYRSPPSCHSSPVGEAAHISRHRCRRFRFTATTDAGRVDYEMSRDVVIGGVRRRHAIRGISRAAMLGRLSAQSAISNYRIHRRCRCRRSSPSYFYPPNQQNIADASCASFVSSRAADMTGGDIGFCCEFQVDINFRSCRSLLPVAALIISSAGHSIARAVISVHCRGPPATTRTPK